MTERKFNFIEGVTGSHWRAKLADLQRFTQDCAEVLEITPHLRSDIERKYEQERSRIYPSVAAGVLGEFRTSLNKYQQLRERFDRKRRAENARFDLSRVETERAAIEGRVRRIAESPGVTNKIQALRELYNECLDGGLDTQRAALEVYQSLGDLGLPGDTEHGHPLRLSVGEFTGEAKQRYSQLRTPADLLTAAGELDQATDDLLKARTEVRLAGEALGEDIGGIFPSGSELGKAYRSVGVTTDGQLQIYAPDSVEVTGVSMARLEGSNA